MRVTRDQMDGATWDLMVAMTRLDRSRQVSDAHAPLVMAQRRILWLLMDGAGRTMRDISEQARLEQSTVNRQVNAAVAAGLVERVRLEGETARTLVVTPTGRAAFEADLARNVRLHEAALAALPADKVDEFAKLLDTFATAYRDVVDAEVAPPAPCASG